MNERTSEFRVFDAWIRRIAEASSNPCVRDSESMISYCIDGSHALPSEYGWRYSDESTIMSLLEGAESAAEVNRIYWTDELRNVEAYAVMSYWRGTELLESSLRSLNWGELVAAAAVGRSLLELAASFLMNANTLDKTLGQVSFPGNACVVCKDLEEFICRIIWGTRLKGHEADLRPQHVLDVLRHLGKNAAAAELMPTYEYLCELAHPNLIGNARFWSRVERMNHDGSETRLLAKDNREGVAHEIVEHILWALGWSSVHVRNGFELTQLAVRSLIESLGRADPY